MTKEQFEQWSLALMAQVEATAEQQREFMEEVAKHDPVAADLLNDVNEAVIKLASHFARKNAH